MVLNNDEQLNLFLLFLFDRKWGYVHTKSMLDLSSRRRKPWEAKYEACMNQLNPKYSDEDNEEKIKYEE